jgi:hypothetical protein
METFANNRWPIGITPQWTSTWRDHRASLVSWIEPGDYEMVARGYAHLDRLQHSVVDGVDDRPVESDDRAFLLRGTAAPVGRTDPVTQAPLTADQRRTLLGSVLGNEADSPPLDEGIAALERALRI